MKKSTVFMALAMLGVIFEAKAQVKFEERLEFTTEGDFLSGAVSPFGEKGFIFQQSDEGKDGISRSFELYNTDFKKVKSVSTTIEKKMMREAWCATSSYLHVLYKNKKGAYNIISVNVDGMSLLKVEGSFPKKSIIDKVVVLGQQMLVTVKVKGIPFLFSIDWTTGAKKLIPINVQGYEPKRLHIENFQVLGQEQEAVLFIKAIYKKEREVFAMIIDPTGNPISTFNMSRNLEENITSISTSKLNDNSYLFTGTYTRKSAELSEGMYFCKASNGRLDFIRFYKFIDMDGFLDYLPEKQQERIEKKKNRAEKKGKELTINYLTVNHDLVFLNDQFVLVAEAYYPTYRSEMVTRTVNGQTVTEYRKKFDGFQYTHAAVVSFDISGQLVWSNIFEMDIAHKPMVPVKYTVVKKLNDQTVRVVYAEGGYIYSKSFDDKGNVIEEESDELIDTGHDGDKIRRGSSTIHYWYAHYFLLYGYQTIKNKEDKSIDRKRRVFYINKVKY